MKDYIISEAKIEQLRRELKTPYCFEADGCDCGEFNIEIEKDIYIHISRGCRKRSSTPDGMKWKLHKVILAEKFEHEEELDKYYEIKDLKLDSKQRNWLEVLAMDRSVQDIGYGEHGELVVVCDESPLQKALDSFKERLSVNFNDLSISKDAKAKVKKKLDEETEILRLEIEKHL